MITRPVMHLFWGGILRDMKASFVPGTARSQRQLQDNREVA
jgi:hypothetical protein